MTPLAEAERWVGDHAVKCFEPVVDQEFGFTKGIAAHDFEVFLTMEKQVHAGNGFSGQVFFLALEL